MYFSLSRLILTACVLHAKLYETKYTLMIFSFLHLIFTSLSTLPVFSSFALIFSSSFITPGPDASIAARSYDGVPFLMHDSTLRRTTDVAEVFPNRTLLDASMFTWAELQQLNAGKWSLSVRQQTHNNTERDRVHQN